MDAKEAASLGEVARIQAAARGVAIAFQFEDHSTGFAQFNANANRIANAPLGGAKAGMA